MRFIHKQHKVGQRRQIVEIAFADLLPKRANARRPPAAYLRRDFSNVEDIDCGRKQLPPRRYLTLKSLAGRQYRRRYSKVRDALKYILGAIRRKVSNQFVVDGKVRREHEKILYTVRNAKIGDERSHEARLADAGRQCEAERGKVPLEIRNARKLAADGRQRRSQVDLFGQRHDLSHTIEDFEAAALRRAQTHTPSDRVYMAKIAHVWSPSSNNLTCLGRLAFGFAIGRLATLRL